MSIYLLETYNELSETIPDFGVAFESIELLLEFVNKQLHPITPAFETSIKEKLIVGWAIGLNDSGSIRVTKIPLIDSAENVNYTNYFKNSKMLHPNNDDSKEFLVPEEPEPEDALTYEKIKDGNIIMNFNDLLTKETPVYYKRTTYNKYKPNINPFEGAKIRTPIKTRKVRIVKHK